MQPFGYAGVRAYMENRYSEDQPRDEKGRFGEGTSGEKTNSEVLAELKSKGFTFKVGNSGNKKFSVWRNPETKEEIVWDHTLNTLKAK